VPMSGMPDMTPTSLAAARTGKIIKNGLGIFERGENLLHLLLTTNTLYLS